MDSVVENIEKLVYELYSDNENVNNRTTGSPKRSIKEINALLMEAQKSKEAWMFLWALMHKEKSLNVQYFGACTLYLKLTKFYFELEINDSIQLRQKLFELLIGYMEQPEYNLVTTKLIMCVAVYVVQNIESTWKNALQNLVEDIFNTEKLSHLPQTRVLQVLLEIFTGIPESLNYSHHDKSKKIRARAELMKYGDSVLNLIYKVLSEENISDDLTKTCLKCFSSWSVDFDVMILTEHHTKVLSIALQNVCNENISHEIVESILHIYTSPHMFKQPKLVMQIIQQMTLGLEPVILKAQNAQNQDYLKDLYSLFISMGENYSRLLLDSIIDQPDTTAFILKFLQIILKCSSTPRFWGYDETLSGMPFNFWITFQDDLIGSDESKIQIYLTLFNELFFSLIDVYLFKVQYPPDEIHDQEWDDEDRDGFRCYRQDIADTFMSSFNILHQNLLLHLMQHFKKALDQIVMAKNVTDKSLVSSYIRYLEAVIFALSSLTENLTSEDCLLMPHLFNSFQTIPSFCLENSRLVATINTFLLSSADWLCRNIDYVTFAMNIISCSLKSNDLNVIISATMALKVITLECQSELSQSHASLIISLCEEYLKYPNMQYKEKARLMHSLGSVLSLMPIDIIHQTIDRILVPFLSETEKFLYVDNNNNPDARFHINGTLLLLSNLFARLDVNLKGTELEEGDEPISKSLIQSKAKNSIKPQPLYIIFEKVLPMFGAIVCNYTQDEEIAVNLCECIKKTVVTLLDDIKPLVSNILQLLLHLYQASKAITVLKISRQLFTLFHKDSLLLGSLQEFFFSLTQITLAIFKYDFHEHTFLAQNFFEECAQSLRKATNIFINPKLDLASVYEWAIQGLILPEKGTIHQSSVFISEFLNQGRGNEYFHAIIIERLDRLVMQVFIVIGGQQGSPSFAVDYVPDIFMALNQKYSDSFMRSLNVMIDCQAFPTEHVSRQQKIQLVQSITMLRNNKRKLKEVIKEFSMQCRGLFLVDHQNHEK